MIELRKIEPELQKEKDRIGLVGTRLEVTNDLPGKSFSAHIQTNWRKIRLDYQRDLDLVPDRETKVYSKKAKIENPELKMGSDVLEHECGHRENRARTTMGCPHDIKTHDKIKSEIARALKESGKDGQTDYVTNAFEDVLDNINCRRHTDFTGQTLFWNNQGLVNSQNQTYNPFYEAFVRTNLFLGGDAKSHTLLSRFFSEDERILPVVKGFLEDICQESGETSPVKIHEKQGFQKLFTKNLEERRQMWERLAYSFASKTADLLEENPQEEMFGGEENPFDEEMKDPQAQEKLAKGRYEAKEGPSQHAELEEQLYSLYRSTSKDIKIETSSFTDSQSMPLVHFGKRFVSERDRRIRFRGIGIDGDGNLGIKTARHSLDFPASYKTTPTQFPNLKIAVMDRSGSMSLSPDNDENVGDTSFIPWGDNSKYHFALKGYFGIDNYFERQGISSHMKCSALGLSGESALRGNSKDVAKKLLHSPGGGHTTLDASGLEKELNERALLVSISDGAISMPSDTTTLDSKLQKCDYAHIQIGGETSYSRYVQSLGKPVIFVRGDEDLSRAMISFVSDYYKTKGQEANK